MMSQAVAELENHWKVEAIFSDLQAWNAELDSVPKGWPEVVKFKGRLGEGADVVHALLEAYFAANRQLDKLYIWAHLRHDEETTHDDHQKAYKRALMIAQDFSKETSWMQAEFLSLDEALLSSYLESDLLGDYQTYLKKIIRLKPHTLTPDKEELLALASKPLGTASRCFRALNDGDLQFGSIQDNEGNEHELTHATYSNYLQSPDRQLRKNAFKALHGKFYANKSTFCEMLTGQVQVHHFQAQARNYGSSLEAALHPKNIEPSVYRALIEGVRDGLPALHRYYEVRKERLGVDTIHPYDFYVPLITELDREVPYEEAEQSVIDSVAPLGSEYQEMLRKGLTEERWVDRFEQKGKRSGAYSSGCYDTSPYILMNYTGTLRDVFTLAHEAGHSMHSYLSWNNQKIQDAYYPIFVAEVASTFNEELLHRLLMERATTEEERRYLIGSRVGDLRATLFRQTMFAEFELRIHEMVEQSIPLTPTLLSEVYQKLNTEYFGPGVVIDEPLAIEWARIPHFYYNFYVYQYATGVSAALALVERVLNGGEKEREEYLNFLRGGCSKFPIELLQSAGVDMTSPEPVKAAVKRFSELVDQL